MPGSSGATIRGSSPFAGLKGQDDNENKQQQMLRSLRCAIRGEAANRFGRDDKGLADVEADTLREG
jgi:hypothetical protein